MPPPGIKPVIFHFLGQRVYSHYLFTVKASSCQFICMLLMWKVSGSVLVFFNPWTVNISLDDEAAAASDARVLSLIFQGEKKHNSSLHMLRSPQDSPGYSVCVCVCWQRGMVDLYSHSLFLFFLDISGFFRGRSEEVVRPFSSSSSSSSEPSQQG